MASQLSQSSSWCQLRMISKIRINLSFMLWRNRTLKRLSSIFHQTKRPGLIEYPLECLKTVYQSPYPLLPIWLILRPHPIALHRCGSPQWSSQTSNPANTRPISLLSIMSKVCEKAANSLWTSWIKIARYPAYREEIESFTPLKPPDYTILISSFRMRMKTNICCCTTWHV